MAEDLGEKTEDATPRKLQQARSRGQIAKSQDFGGALTLAASLAVVIVFGSLAGEGLQTVMRVTLGEAAGPGYDVHSAGAAARMVAYEAAFIVTPIFGVMFLAVAIAQFVQVGPLFTTYPLQPKLNKLNPITGFGRLFNKKQLFKSLMNLVKLAVVIGVSVLYFRWRTDMISSLVAIDALQSILTTVRLVIELGLILTVLLLIIGVADWMFQRWQHKQELKMTKSEVKDERRTVEGDPEVRGRRMRMMQEIAQQRIQGEVPNADVIITNPTHYSVALRYDEDSMRAPRLVAKGVDHLALHIRMLARHNDVPIVERPPLARGIYHGVEVGQEIPGEFYEAVAEILAYVYRLREGVIDAETPFVPREPVEVGVPSGAGA